MNIKSFVIILRAMIICLNEQTVKFAIEEDVIKDIKWKIFQDVFCDLFSLIFLTTLLVNINSEL